MKPFNRDNINLLTNFILNDDYLRSDILKEDWKGLFKKLISPHLYVKLPDEIRRLCTTTWDGGWSGFLYHYFLELDNFNILPLVGKISEFAFAFDQDLNQTEIPDNIVAIENSAFYYCNHLEKVIIPESVAYIGQHAFQECINLKEINIDEGVFNIEDEAFGNCKSLENLTLPKSLIFVGGWAFAGCDKLKEIIYKDTMDSWKKLMKNDPKSVFAKTNDLVIKCTDGEVKYYFK